MKDREQLLKIRRASAVFKTPVYARRYRGKHPEEEQMYEQRKPYEN